MDEVLATELLPDEAAISVITIAELELGVHVAESDEIRGRRLRPLQSLRAQGVWTSSARPRTRTLPLKTSD